MELLHKELTDRIIRCFYQVYNSLGFGFLEKVYERALMIELAHAGLLAKKQQPVTVYYDNQVVGEYIADIIVEDCVILELKAAELINEEFELQLINYLKATNIEVGLVLNFGKKPEIRRKVFSNARKTAHTDNAETADMR